MNEKERIEELEFEICDLNTEIELYDAEAIDYQNTIYKIIEIKNKLKDLVIFDDVIFNVAFYNIYKELDGVLKKYEQEFIKYNKKVERSYKNE